MKSPRTATTIDLSVGQTLALARLVRSAIRKQARRNASSTFVPEPGKRHAGEAIIEGYEQLLDVLLAACDATIEDLEDGGTPRRREGVSQLENRMP